MSDDPTRVVTAPPPPTTPPPAGSGASWSTQPPPRRGASAGTVLIGGLFVVAGILWILQAAGVVDDPWRAAFPGALIATGLALLVEARRGLHSGLMTVGVILTLALAVLSIANIPVTGGVGERDIRPATLADIDSPYELGAGDMTLDLTAVDFPPGETHIVARVGVGQLEVTLPPDVGAIIEWEVGAGEITIFSNFQQSGVNLDGIERREGSESIVRLELSIGVGEIEVYRGR